MYAKSIVEQNIRIEAGRRRQDFSDLGGGFYAGSSLRSAVKFAKKRLDRLESPGITRPVLDRFHDSSKTNLCTFQLISSKMRKVLQAEHKT